MDHRDRWPRWIGWTIAGVASLVLWAIIIPLVLLIINVIKENL